MATAKQVFEALPHVNEIWVTQDGHHHLHSHNGGHKFVRLVKAEAMAEAMAEAAKAEAEAEEKITQTAAQAKAQSGNKK